MEKEMCQSRLSILKSIWDFFRSFHLRGSVKASMCLSRTLIQFFPLASSSVIIHRRAENLHSICFLPSLFRYPSIRFNAHSCSYSHDRNVLLSGNIRLFASSFSTLQFTVHFIFYFSISTRHQPQYIWQRRRKNQKKVHWREKCFKSTLNINRISFLCMHIPLPSYRLIAELIIRRTPQQCFLYLHAVHSQRSFISCMSADDAQHFSHSLEWIEKLNKSQWGILH